jgi:hypothetical protein
MLSLSAAPLPNLGRSPFTRVSQSAPLPNLGRSPFTRVSHSSHTKFIGWNQGCALVTQPLAAAFKAQGDPALSAPMQPACDRVRQGHETRLLVSIETNQWAMNGTRGRMGFCPDLEVARFFRIASNLGFEFRPRVHCFTSCFPNLTSAVTLPSTPNTYTLGTL